ncbi:hypothetical protein DER44DRAFT_805616 [Fusarium oxysporum]|nr:hypothetical protein DER44DRAFT_805616 [Fusarium oxysporum]
MLKHYDIKQVVIITNCNKSKGLSGKIGGYKVAYFLPKYLSRIIKVLHRLAGICRLSNSLNPAWLIVLSYWHMAVEIGCKIKGLIIWQIDLKAAKADSNNKVANPIIVIYSSRIAWGHYRPAKIISIAIINKAIKRQ